jgi:predicted HTH transcriptional regulator
MSDLPEIIEHENEHSALDFKAKAYSREGFSELLRDVISMANANVSGVRRIVMGVKLKKDGSREYQSIEEKDMLDSASYEQLVRENIEPPLHFALHRIDFKGHKLAVFEISDCNSGPYMMKKNYGSLEGGEAFMVKQLPFCKFLF